LFEPRFSPFAFGLEHLAEAVIQVQHLDALSGVPQADFGLLFDNKRS
jgi:hypothetical protein